METIERERRGRVEIVRLANPPVNAVTQVMMTELKSCMNELSEDKAVGSVVLCAQGDRAFCAGIDLTEGFPAAVDDRTSIASLLDPGLLWREAQNAVRHCTVPVVAAVEAPSIGAGFGLVALCDIIVASTRASFGLTEINVGLLGGASKALRMVGPYKARMMFFSGELLPAEELYRLGAIERLVDKGEAEEFAVQLAGSFSEKSPIALRLAKESLLRIESMGFDVEQAYRTEQDYTIRLSQYADSAEAKRAYLERRPPSWSWS